MPLFSEASGLGLIEARRTTTAATRAQAFLRAMPPAEAARVLGSKDRLARALNGADPVAVFDAGALPAYRTRLAGQSGADNGLMPQTPADRMIAGLIDRAGRAERFAGLWVDEQSFERHLARRVRVLHVAGEEDYTMRTRRTLAGAHRVVVVTPRDPLMHVTGKVAMIGGDWIVLLSEDGRIVTSYPFDAHKERFEERHEKLGDRIDEHQISEAHRRLLARVFGPA